ncbi:Acetyl-/propionyl-coenzyme A carboxylase alpha chain (Includes: Biotin carboxylase; Biotin carboxyl carrier protein) [Magnetospirillum sp. LM-5]|uniref:acetyl/propionyl/methylcrotonyl-CoA carboxylase subunit alpha n=1 Tax=Magnetospirillum sp. LM-5 TaxID=2681466 RepID=UPI00137F689B|nr:acetyl/propionyl/methylcrotonyl-CoA carboxylase subunit alpha [Magnetospirillum sp. LM-5]CAA7619635.1 Acetyl-/propionyl-coenzyme A carboxylase alpha chain (Includes: Biotin carboxylase; Biotin carboxyl carrier protein) [Magnetospirillum sp. LM-5]
MFDKILIANRGEIAVRVIRTAKRLGIRTVAVYSEADCNALHVRLADEAILIGPAAAAESYLVADKILAAAKATGAQAIHPGYGFLSENAAFAEACAAQGVTFIGPPAGAIRAMGSKAESKRLMESARVPMVPGYHGADQSDAVLTQAAMDIGFPVLVKASAGGGGKGMRVVRAEPELAAAIAGARREAKASFGDDSLLLERYLDHPRHVEIQVFCDRLGNGIYLFERDCSAQRRHQKVIEEAPAPLLPDEVRQAMGEAAVQAAKAVSYEGAGTVEFLFQDGQFYFIEMNTRLQVEHPVTEMITGQDLVEWQLLVAAGRPLPLGQHELTRKGHAFEARLYAEDPAKDFLPATGRLVHLVPPTASPHVRVDTGVVEGDEVTAFYDPMIAKLIVWDEDRDSALRRLRRALADYEVAGLVTNISFLAAIAGHPAFAAFEMDTGFIDRHRADLIPAIRNVPAPALAFAAAALLLDREDHAAAAAARSGDRWSPWHQTGGWRMNDDNHHDFRLIDADAVRLVTVHFRTDGWEVDLDGGTMRVRGASRQGRRITAELDGERRSASVVTDGFDITVLLDGASWRLKLDDPSAKAADQDGPGSLAAPMTGRVVQVLVAAGDRVERGQPLMVVEAMKMEHTIAAPADGTVKEVLYAVGDQVADGAELLAFDADEAKK